MEGGGILSSTTTCLLDRVLRVGASGDDTCVLLPEFVDWRGRLDCRAYRCENCSAVGEIGAAGGAGLLKLLSGVLTIPEEALLC